MSARSIAPGVFCLTALCTFVGSANHAARGQSINVDIGSGAGTPSATYPAAGLPGVWNSLPGGHYSDIPLLDLDGLPTAATMGSWSFGDQAWDHPSTQGNDERLLDDFVSTGDVVMSWGFSNLANGHYLVLVYAWIPWGGNPSTGVWIGGWLTAPFHAVGGPWPGELQEGVTHARELVQVTDGTVAVSVVGGLNSSGGCNGIQLVFNDCNLNGTPDDQDIAHGPSRDCNDNGIPDECELLGDLNGDGDTDLADYSVLAECLSGPHVTTPPLLCAVDQFEAADIDADGDVDTYDFGLLQVLLGTAP